MAPSSTRSRCGNRARGDDGFQRGRYCCRTRPRCVGDVYYLWGGTFRWVEASVDPQDHANLEPGWLSAADARMRAHAQTLDRCFADLEAALMGQGPISHTLSVLRRISLECGIPMAIVGGIAGAFYGLRRTTQDIDIVIDKDHLPVFCEKAVEAGFAQEGPTQFSIAGGYPVDILVSGTYPTPDSLHPTPTPAELGVPSGLDYAELPAWISLKLLAGRPEDLGDVYRLLRQKKRRSAKKSRRSSIRGPEVDTNGSWRT